MLLLLQDELEASETADGGSLRRERSGRNRVGVGMLCQRCGDEIQGDSTKPGWSHFEWRRRATAAAAAAAATRAAAASRRTGRLGKKGKLEAALDKLERQDRLLLGLGEPAFSGGATASAERTLTYCNACLQELARSELNRSMIVSEILRFRQVDAAPHATAASLAQTGLRRHSPER